MTAIPVCCEKAKYFGEWDCPTHSPSKKDLEAKCDSYIESAAHFEQDLFQANKKIAQYLWNLGGCSTYALGYELDSPGHDKEMALPALEDVLKMALKNRELEAEIKRLGDVHAVLEQIKSGVKTGRITVDREAFKLLHQEEIGELKQENDHLKERLGFPGNDKLAELQSKLDICVKTLKEISKYNTNYPTPAITSLVKYTLSRLSQEFDKDT
jgi:hypothetical protein